MTDIYICDIDIDIYTGPQTERYFHDQVGPSDRENFSTCVDDPIGQRERVKERLINGSAGT